MLQDCTRNTPSASTHLGWWGQSLHHSTSHVTLPTETCSHHRLGICLWTRACASASLTPAGPEGVTACRTTGVHVPDASVSPITRTDRTASVTLLVQETPCVDQGAAVCFGVSVHDVS